MTNEEMKKDGFEIIIQSEVGKFTSNMSEVLDFTRERIKDYLNLTPTEENYAIVKAQRAELNKAAKAFDDTWKTAVERYNKPLEQATYLAKEIKNLFKSADKELGSKIAAITESIQNDILESNIFLMGDIVDKEVSDAELMALIADCEKWIVKDNWKNKTTSRKQVKQDVEEAIEKCKQAMELFTGEFAPHMLAKFKECGDLGTAQLLGTTLKKQKDDYNKKIEMAQPSEPNVMAQPSEPNVMAQPSEPTFTRYIRVDDITEEQFKLIIEYFKANNIHGKIYRKIEEIK